MTALRRRRNINDPRAFVGTCPDMCPEKERYERENGRMVSVYEMLQDSDPHVSLLTPTMDI